MSAAPNLQAILQPLDRDLDGITQRVLQCLRHPIARLAVYLITAGGKRLRPALVVLAGHSGQRKATRQALVDLAAATELIHTATLIHDDIIDGAQLRRKQPTFHTRFGTERAVLMGDYLYATAFWLLAQLRQPYVITYMAQVCQQMSQGEFQEVDQRFRLTVTEADYFQVIRDKTASLIAACCHLGAYLSGAKPQTIERLSAFGLNFGMAFQIMDDCLDLMGKERTMGKTLRSDLEKGSLSLPVIYLARSLSPKQRTTLFSPLQQRRVDPSSLSRIAQATRRSGAIGQAVQTAKRFAQEATHALALRDGIGLAGTYRQLAHFAVERDS